MKTRNLLLCATAILVSPALSANPLCTADSTSPSVPMARQLPYAGLCESLYTSTLPDDYFYTMSWSEHRAAQVVHRLTALDPVVSIYLEGRQQPGTAPLYRFFSPSAVAHYYSTNSKATDGKFPGDWILEQIAVKGQTRSRIEGYVYPSQAAAPPTAVAIRRWVRYTPDLAYRMTLSATAPGSGWLADGIVGYGFAAQGKSLFRGAGELRSVSSDWASGAVSAVRMMRRCLDGVTHSATSMPSCHARGMATVSGAYYRPDLFKSPFDTVHTMSFRFSADGFFHYDGGDNNSHLSVGTRGFLDVDYTPPKNASSRLTQHGLGLTIGPWHQCSSTSRPHVAIEAWSPYQQADTRIKVDPASCSPALQPGMSYQIDLATSDAGEIRYTLSRVGSSGALILVHRYYSANAKDLFTDVTQTPDPNAYPSSANYAHRNGAWILPVVDFRDGATVPGTATKTYDDEFTIDVWNISTGWRIGMPAE